MSMIASPLTLMRKLKSLRGQRQTIGSAPQFKGLATGEALVLLAKAAGVETSLEALTAGLPIAKQQMDPRLAPIALARVGLDGQWRELALNRLEAALLPALVHLPAGGCLVARDIAAPGYVNLIDAAGTHLTSLESLAALGKVSLLSCGTADPVNGTDALDDRSELRANPKRWIVGQLLTDRKLLGQLCLTAAMANLLALSVPFYLRAVYDRVVPNLAIETLWALSLGVMIALVTELAFKSIRTGFVDAIGVRLSHIVQHKVMNALMQARLAKAPNLSGSVSIALRDIDQLAVTLPGAVAVFLVDLPFFLIFAAVLWHLGGPVVVAALAGGVFIAAVGLWANIHLRKQSARSTQLSQARANAIVDAVEGLPTLKAYQAQGQFMRSWDKLTDHAAMTATRTREWAEKPMHAASFLVQLVTVMVIIIGVFQIQANVLSVGGLVASTLIAGRAMVPVSNAVGIISRAYQGLSQFASLSSLLSLEPEKDISDPTVRERPIEGELRLNMVTFAYEGSAAPALSGVTLAIGRGEKVALIGKSGSGKSTLLHLLAALQQPDSGTFLIDGFNADHYAASQLRRAIVLQGQDMQLFDATIFENLTIGVDTIDEALLRGALRAAGIEGFIAQQSDGLSFKPGPRGARLSGGQRQAVMLARALARPSAVLLLDEPTSAMDIASEQTVIAGLRAAAADKTLIIATHRLALLELVDRVIWLDQGRIVADKPRDEVMAMFRAQSVRATAQASAA